MAIKQIIIKINTTTGEVKGVGEFIPGDDNNRGSRRTIPAQNTEPKPKPKNIGCAIKMQLQHQNPYWIKIGNRWYRIG